MCAYAPNSKLAQDQQRKRIKWGNPAHTKITAEELCASRDAHHGFPIPNSQYGLCAHKATLNEESAEVRSCVRVEVVVLGSPFLIVHMIVHKQCRTKGFRAQELCESRSDQLGLPVRNSPYGLCGHKAT